MATFTVRPEGIIRQPALTMPGNATGSEAACTALTASQIRSLCSVYSTSEVDAIAAAKVSAASLALGTTGSDLNWSGTTLNVPDAGASARGVVTTGAQTIAGAKTFSGGLSLTGGHVDISQNVRLRFFDGGAANRGEIYMDDATDSVICGSAFGNGFSFAALGCTGVATIGSSGVLRFNSRFDVSLVSDSLVINNTNGNDWAYQKAGVDCFRLTFGGIATWSVPMVFSSSVTAGAAFNLAPITKAALLVLTPTAATAGRWRVTDATPASREAYPDGTNWRYTSDDTIVV